MVPPAFIVRLTTPEMTIWRLEAERTQLRANGRTRLPYDQDVPGPCGNQCPRLLPGTTEGISTLYPLPRSYRQLSEGTHVYSSPCFLW